MTECSSIPASLSLALRAWCPEAMPTETPPSLPPCCYLTKKHSISLTHANFEISLCAGKLSSPVQIQPVCLHRSNPRVVKNILLTSLQQFHGGPAASRRAYINAEIFIYIHIFSIFKKEHFSALSVCHIYEEGRLCPHSNTATHPLNHEPRTPRLHTHRSWNTHMQTRDGTFRTGGRGEVSILGKRKTSSHDN